MSPDRPAAGTISATEAHSPIAEARAKNTLWNRSLPDIMHKAGITGYRLSHDEKSDYDWVKMTQPEDNYLKIGIFPEEE